MEGEHRTMTSGLGKVGLRRLRLAVLMALVGVGFLVSTFMPSAPRSSAQNNGSISCSASKTFLPVTNGTQNITLSASGGTPPYQLGAMSSAGAFEIIVSTSIARNASYTIIDSSLPTRKICSITIQIGGASPPPDGGGGGGGGGGVTPPGSIVHCRIDQGGTVKPNTQVTITASGGVPPYRYSVESYSQFGSSGEAPLSSNIHYPKDDGYRYTYYAKDYNNSQAVCGTVQVSSSEPPGLSTFIVIVLEKTSKVPIEKATVHLNNNSKKTLANGTASFNLRLDLKQRVRVIPPSYCQAETFETYGELDSPYQVLVDCAPDTPAVGITTDLVDPNIYEGEYIPVSIYRLAKNISKPLTVDVEIATGRSYATANVDYSLPADFKKKGVYYTVTIPANKGSVSYLLLTKRDLIDERLEEANFDIIESSNNGYTVFRDSKFIFTFIKDFDFVFLYHDIFTQPKNEIIWTTESIRYQEMPSQHLIKYETRGDRQIEGGYNCQIIGYANKSIDRPCRASESGAIDVAQLLNPQGIIYLEMRVSRQGMIVGDSTTLEVNTKGFNTCVIKLGEFDEDYLGSFDENYMVILYNVTQKKYQRVQYETDIQLDAESREESTFNYITDLLPKNKYLVYILEETRNINFRINYSNAPLSPACIKSRAELIQLPVMVEL